MQMPTVRRRFGMASWMLFASAAAALLVAGWLTLSPAWRLADSVPFGQQLQVQVGSGD